jgi:uncharacterized oxidoreductase
MKLEGNTILITGGTSGIGLAFAEKFLALGNKVIICGRREDRLKALKEKHKNLFTEACDVSVAEEREKFFQRITQQHPDLNVLMNNAGVQYASNLKEPANLRKLYNEIETNLIAPIHLSTLFAKHLSSKKDGIIINISSGLAFAPLAFMPVYCATKAAVHSFTMSLRHQLKDTSIKVFEVAPPSVDTELGHDRREDKSQSHGGLPISEFLEEAMEGLKNNVLETAVGQAKGLRAKREELFSMMNK